MILFQKSKRNGILRRHIGGVANPAPVFASALQLPATGHGDQGDINDGPSRKAKTQRQQAGAKWRPAMNGLKITNDKCIAIHKGKLALPIKKLHMHH